MCVHYLFKDKTQKLLSSGCVGHVIPNFSGPSSYLLVCSWPPSLYNWSFISYCLYFPGNFIQPMDRVKKRSICSIQTSSLPVNGKLFCELWVTLYFCFEEVSSQLEEWC